MRILLAVIALTGLALRVWDLGDVGISHWDAGSYTAAPYGIGPYGKAYILPFYAPPLTPTLAYFAFETFGHTALVATVLMALMGAATVLAVYDLGRRLFGRSAGMIGAAALAGMAYHVVYSRQPLADVPYALLFVLAVRALWIGWHEERRTAFLVAGVWAGACLLTKYHGFFPLVVFALLVGLHHLPGLVRHREDEPGPAPTTLSGCKGLVLAGGIMAIPAAWLAWDIGTNIGFDVFRANRQSWIPEMGLWLIPQTAAYVAAALGHWVSLTVLAAAAVGFAVMLWRRHAGDVLMLLWAGLFLATLPLYMNYPRLLVPLLVPLALAAGVGLQWFGARLLAARPVAATALLSTLVLLPGLVGTAPLLSVSDRGYEHAAAWLVEQGPGDLPDLLLTQHAILFYLAGAPNQFLALDEPELAAALAAGRFRFLLADLREQNLPAPLRDALDRLAPHLQRVRTVPNPLPEPFVVNLVGFSGLAELSSDSTDPARREALSTIRIWRNELPDQR